MIDEVRLFKDINRRDYISKAMREIFETIIDEQPVLQTWIPVSERLPDEPEENPVFDNKQLELYLVSVKNADYAFRAFWNGISFTDGWSKLNVVAWMPLPAPYRPEPGKE